MGCLQLQGLGTSTYLQEHVESRDALTVCEPECHTLETSRTSHRTRLSPLVSNAGQPQRQLGCDARINGGFYFKLRPRGTRDRPGQPGEIIRICPFMVISRMFDDSHCLAG
jgi:hypothetical protein